MLGAIAGDVIGSVHESTGTKTTEFPLFTPASRFTDDTVLTVAVAHAILSNSDYSAAVKQFGRRFPDAGYGMMFRRWLASPGREPYGSFGNGSAMRASPVGFAYDSLETVLAEAARSAAATHDHPEGIKGAQATALAVFLAREGETKDAIEKAVARRFGYDLDRTLDAIRPGYGFDETCQGTVPEALIAFLESVDYEDAVRKAVSLGGDADTLACITGGIAQAFYKQVPETIARTVRERLPEDLLIVLDAFNERYGL